MEIRRQYFERQHLTHPGQQQIYPGFNPVIGRHHYFRNPCDRVCQVSQRNPGFCWCGGWDDWPQDKQIQEEEADELAMYVLKRSEQEQVQQKWMHQQHAQQQAEQQKVAEAAAMYARRRDAYVTRMEAKQTEAEEEAVRKAEVQERASGLRRQQQRSVPDLA